MNRRTISTETSDFYGPAGSRRRLFLLRPISSVDADGGLVGARIDEGDFKDIFIVNKNLAIHRRSERANLKA